MTDDEFKSSAGTSKTFTLTPDTVARSAIGDDPTDAEPVPATP